MNSKKGKDNSKRATRNSQHEAPKHQFSSKKNRKSLILTITNAHNASNELTDQTPNTKHQTPAADEGWQAFSRPPQFIVAVLLLGATLVLAQGVEFREKIPMSRSFIEFPLQVGEWSGKRDVLDQIFIDDARFQGLHHRQLCQQRHRKIGEFLHGLLRHPAQGRVDPFAGNLPARRRVGV